MPTLTFGVSMSNKANHHDQSQMSVYIHFRKNNGQLWELQEGFHLETSQRTQSHLYSLLWKKSGDYAIYIDDILLK